MANFVVLGATLSCSMGLTPGTTKLIVKPSSRVTSGNKPVANIQDSQTGANIPLFGMCQAIANPTVVAATAANSGVKAPGACGPLSFSPWMPGSMKTTVGGQPALTKESTCLCNYGGTVKVEDEGQNTASVG